MPRNSVLHTWSANLNLHCHIHVLFCAAGLDKNGEFKSGKEDFIFPAKKLAEKFKGNFIKIVQKIYEHSSSRWLNDLNAAKKEKWNVEVKPCQGDPEHVIKYTSRYINRTAISNGRLISYKDGKIKFVYKNYRKDGELETMELEDVEFIRRFRMHILPSRFIRCRSYGFLGNNAKELLKKVQKLSGLADPLSENSVVVEVDISELKKAGSSDSEGQVWRCPKCKCIFYKEEKRSREFDPYFKDMILTKKIEAARIQLLLSG